LNCGDDRKSHTVGRIDAEASHQLVRARGVFLLPGVYRVAERQQTFGEVFVQAEREAEIGIAVAV